MTKHISSFKPQKALHLYLELDKKRTTIAEDTFAVFEKYDGWYGSKRVGDAALNSCLITSRNKREIPSLTSFSREIYANEALNNIPLRGVLIFEILVREVPVFKDLNGILNRSKAPCQAKGAYLMVHDFVPDGNHNMPFLDRYKLAKQYCAQLGDSNVLIAPIINCGTYDVVQSAAEDIWARHNPNLSNEGAIGKRVDAPYSEGKKNKDIIKVKCEVTLECLVVGWEKGTGKYVGTLGALIVRQANGRQHTVSGMSDGERAEWYNDFSVINNKVVELQAMQILDNGSLREGRYKCIRHDKDISEID